MFRKPFLGRSLPFMIHDVHIFHDVCEFCRSICVRSLGPWCWNRSISLLVQQRWVHYLFLSWRCYYGDSFTWSSFYQVWLFTRMTVHDLSIVRYFWFKRATSFILRHSDPGYIWFSLIFSADYGCTICNIRTGLFLDFVLKWFLMWLSGQFISLDKVLVLLQIRHGYNVHFLNPAWCFCSRMNLVRKFHEIQLQYGTNYGK